MKFIGYIYLGLLISHSYTFCVETRSLKSFLGYSYENYDNHKLADLFNAYIAKNHFTLTDMELKNSLHELKVIAGSNRMYDILQEVNKRLEVPMDYYHQRINNKFNYLMLGCGLTAALFCIAGFAITYKIYAKWHGPANIEYAQIKSDLEKMDVVITHDYTNFGKTIVNYIGLKANRPLSHKQWKFARKCQGRLVKIANDKEWAINAEIFAGVLNFFSLSYPVTFFYHFLYPRYKEHYEKYKHIQEVLEEELKKYQ